MSILIYDFGMDSLLNGFIRDSTNDGDGWNSRLSPLLQSGEHGYPSLYSGRTKITDTLRNYTITQNLAPRTPDHEH